MKIRTKIPKLQMHENLHKNVSENEFSFKFFMQIFMSSYDEQLKQQMLYMYTANLNSCFLIRLK